MAQYLLPESTFKILSEELLSNNRSDDQQFQFLNSSSSACEDEEEGKKVNVRNCKKFHQFDYDTSELCFGDFKDDEQLIEIKDSPKSLITHNKEKSLTFCKKPIENNALISKNSSDDTSGVHDKQPILASTTVTTSTSETISSSMATVSSAVEAPTITTVSTSVCSSKNMIAQELPIKSCKYTIEELKMMSKSNEARKPPLVTCQKGDCISQLFVSRQQYNYMNNQSASSTANIHMQQQYQPMNYNESMEFVAGKRRNQNRKCYDHIGNINISNNNIMHNTPAASSSNGGNAGGVSGSLNNAVGLSGGGQFNRKVEIIRVHLSLNEEIKLSECENAWQPEALRNRSLHGSPKNNASSASTSGSLNDDLEVVLKRVRGVLNKLTPDNFDVLLKTMTNISMNTQEKMQRVNIGLFIIIL